MLVVLIAALMVATAASGNQNAPETVRVDLQQGKIEGVRESSIRDSKIYYSFKGIPYAEPPVGDLRFKDPVPAKPWLNVRKGVIPPPCPQFIVGPNLVDGEEIIGEEDCLYLNVYTPRPYVSDLPVMVYIHGGGFKFGSADSLGGTPSRLLTKDVVLVSIQYRLGTLGFMSTGDSVLPGNYGLKDQTLALQWVKNNIQSFGGDTKRITIFGESAGAICVHFHMFVPSSRELFDRAILQSGTAINPLAIRNDHAAVTTKIGKALKCPGADSSPIDSTQLLSCFRQASVKDLVSAPAPFTIMGFPYLMVPRVDGDYLPAHPAWLLREGRYQKVDLISGNCKNEGATGVKALLLSNQTTNSAFMEQYITNVLPLLLGVDIEENPQYLTRRALYHYMDEVLITDKNADDLEKLLTESYMKISQDEAAIFHSRDALYGRSVFRYELEHRGQWSLADWANTSAGKKWVAHVDDLQYLFDGVIGSPPVQRPDDVHLSDIMVSLWTNFARTGNPTPDLSLGFKWDSMTSVSDLRYLSLVPAPIMKRDQRSANREFWRDMPLLRNKLLFPTRFLCTTRDCRR